jgi:MFS family permease
VSAERAALQHRTLRVLFIAQTFSGVGLAAGIAVGALLAQEMLGSTGSSGLPTALFTLGSAGAAVLVGRISQRAGRRPGLASGYAVGAVGAALVVLAAAIDSVPLLFAALVLYGSGTATNLQARYTGGDLAEPSKRARAISAVLVATTLGAVIGPNLGEPTGEFAATLGIPHLAGPFLLAAVAYGAAAVAVFVLLRPDPLISARAFDLTAAAAGQPSVELRTTIDAPRLRAAAAGMVITQLVMVAIMTMTPIHMRDHGHGLAASGAVISIHVAAMFLPSPLSGRLVDRFGPLRMFVVAGLTLLSAGIVAALAPEDSVALLAVGLALLGLGWSFGLISGTAMVTDAVPLAERARLQGTVDLFIALAGATGGLGSGFIVAAGSYTALALGGGALALVLIPIVLTTPRAVPVLTPPAAQGP